MSADTSLLGTFDYVVVLMLENRSFDNILGYLYRSGAPGGKSFEGVAGKSLTNPDINGNPVAVSIGAELHQPYPDPGEEFDHVTAQLFDNSLSVRVPPMQGFVKDYYQTLLTLTGWRGSPSVQSPTIMKCFAPDSIPVLSALAQEFAVFDHWFCAVPSQTWCNRAFWHAATSWGWVNNPQAFDKSAWGLDQWAKSSVGPTLFNLIETRFGTGNWHIYEDLGVPFTQLIHWGDLRGKIGENYFRHLEGGHPFYSNFFDDCARGELPRYSFLEPHFINFLDDAVWHDDMHPSSFGSALYSDGGPGSVLLGDQLIWKVYQAIRNSTSETGNNWGNTLLIITFDEHGGCFDHVPPPATVSPNPNGFNTGIGQGNFDFKRLGVRVPMVMISAHIAKNTIVNTEMHHCSFLKTMQQKWGLDTDLGPRADSAPVFSEVFTSSSRTIDTWPNFEEYPRPFPRLEAAMMRQVDPSSYPINGLQGSILNAIVELHPTDPSIAGMRVKNGKDALAVLNRVRSLRYPAR